MIPAIEIQSLSKTFTGKRGACVDAVIDLSLSIHTGEVFGFLGPNGAGKSTTIKVLMGLLKPTSGNISIAGAPAGSPASKLKIGYLPENPALYDHLTAEEYLYFVGQTFGMSGNALSEALDRVLRLLDLHNARKRMIRTYSKGMTQRLALAQVLIHDPEICILDEPMSGLDPLGRALVKDIILDLKRREKSVFFSTHITSDVEQVCDRIGILARGSLQTVASVENVLNEGIEGYYLYTSSKAGNSETFAPKDQLTQIINDMNLRGERITLIEPKRKNLEAFFLDIVQYKNK